MPGKNSAAKIVFGFKKTAFWVMAITVFSAAVLGIWLTANRKFSSPIKGSSYRVEEILYEAGMYSFSYTLGTAPQYSISSDYVLYVKEHSDTDWTRLDKLVPYQINKEEIHALFTPFFSVMGKETDVRKRIDQIEKLYRADMEGEFQRFYLVMQLKNGEVLLALGYDHDLHNPHVRWLFKLKKAGSFDPTD